MIDNEKNETGKNEEQTREEVLKDRELSDENLEQVSGGEENTEKKGHNLKFL